jgi:hypothetical protein
VATSVQLTSELTGIGEAWVALGWLIVAGWTVVLTAPAARAYRRDTSRA